MPGAPDQEYARARTVLLDALEALETHLNAVILVGAQAIYLHTGEAEFAVAAYTTDADLAVVPADLADTPKLADALAAAGFNADAENLGIWISRSVHASVDLLVPESLGGPGRRGARLGPHGNRVARKARGLEAAVVENAVMPIKAFDAADHRRFDVRVAGPGALLVAKLHKLWERREQPRRQDDKDAFDAYRLLSYMETTDAAARLRALASDARSSEVTREALAFLETLFATADAQGSAMAGRYVEGLDDPAFVSAACGALAQDLLSNVRN
ncbi:MAG TPA: GSU2403 family nucleotidyltransferase fold protein [Chloroflexota bacterium]|nr:GSU2403 family nucleotidyltransferase fold protein [Chloroflexota bacterium]